MPVTKSGGFGVPEEIILATSKIPFLGGDFACPNQSGAYLRVSYGGFKKVYYTYVDAGPAKVRAPINALGDPSVHELFQYARYRPT